MTLSANENMSALPYAITAMSAHAVAVGAALVALEAFDARHAPRATGVQLPLPRLAASFFAVPLTLTIEIGFGVAHPLAPATALLITLGIVGGSFRQWVTLMIGLAIISTIGGLARA